MKRFTIYTLMGFILPLISCTNSNSLSEDEKIQITKNIEETLNGYPGAFQRHDLNWFQEFWFNDKDFVMAGDGRMETIYDSTVTQRYRKAFATVKEVLHFKFSNGLAHVINRDAVSYTTNFDWGFVDLSGDTLKSNGSWLYVFKKSGGKWRVIQSAGTHNYYK